VDREKRDRRLKKAILITFVLAAANSRFINGVHHGFVDFSYHGWHQELLTERITPDDVRWMSERLAKLSDAQWRDAFRAGGFNPPIADRFVRRLKATIDEGRKLTTS